MRDRAQRTRGRILDSAAEEFATHGHDGATPWSVADRIGMTTAAMYGHFTSTQAAAAALEAYGAPELSALRPDGGALDPVDTLRRLVGEFGARLQPDIRLRASHPAAAVPVYVHSDVPVASLCVLPDPVHHLERPADTARQTAAGIGTALRHRR